MNYDEVIQFIKEKPIELSSFIKTNNNLCNFTEFHLEVTLNSIAEEKHLSYISDEICNTINKRIMTRLFESRKYDYYNLSSDMMASSHKDLRKIYDIISNSKAEYKNVITTGMIASSLQDLSEFVVSPNPNNYPITRPGSIYKVGKLLEMDIWVDPYMKFNDGRMVLFKDVEVNISDIDVSIKNGPSFAPRLLIEFKFDINIDDPKLIFIIENEYSETFNHFKSLQRSIKINDVLNEED